MSDAAEQAKLEAVGDETARLLASHLVYPCVLLTQVDIGRLDAAGPIIFAAGDDLLFKGRFSEELLRNLQEQYHRITGNLTCW